MADSHRQVLRILRNAAASILGEDPAKRQQGIESLIGWHGFDREQATRWWDDSVRRDWGGFALINTPPGSGKSRDATEFANVLWEQAGIKSLYLMLTHKAICERIKRLKEDGKWDQWSPVGTTQERVRHYSLQ